MISPLVKRLEGVGFVTRTRDPSDERRVLVDLRPVAVPSKPEIRGIPDKDQVRLSLTDQGVDDLRLGHHALAHPGSERTPQGIHKRYNNRYFETGHIGKTLVQTLSSTGHG